MTEVASAPPPAREAFLRDPSLPIAPDAVLPGGAPNTPIIPEAAKSQHGWKHFAGMFGGEHIAATEFVIGAAFVAMGVSTRDLLLGLVIGNGMAVLAWALLTAPIAVKTRLSLYAYLEKIAGPGITKLFNLANMVVYGAIAAAMINVSATAVRFLLDIPVQLQWYPESLAFVAVVIVLGVVVVAVAAFGFDILARFSGACAPWMLAAFVCGGLTLMPALAQSVTGSPHIGALSELGTIANGAIWTGRTPDGDPGVGMWAVAGYAFGAIAALNLGLVDMALFRFAKKASYGYLSSVGMFLGHVIGWLAAGVMGAGAALLAGESLARLDTGDVAHAALGLTGILVVIAAGWTTANASLYRAGLAASNLAPKLSRKAATLGLGVFIVALACFPAVYRAALPILVYSGVVLSPVGAIVMAEHYLFPRMGLTRYWVQHRGLSLSWPAVATWGATLALAAGLIVSGWVSYYWVFAVDYVFALVLYTVLAAVAGARERFPRREAREVAREEALAEFEQERAEVEAKTVQTSRLGGILGWLAWAPLLVMVFAAWRVADADTSTLYETMRGVFGVTALVATGVYFALAISAQVLTERAALASRPA
ncbi:hypothetical protein [Brevundimonas sp.]|jgi:purine-cytosine permease-like protein|uniref:hypothetical protein n=1 Tax=Brevundimonas sp. TaxID=1871086 RepID=UPI0037C070AD